MIFACEGPSYAGKTTAVAALRRVPGMRDAVFFDCYVHSLPEGEAVPRAAVANAAEQLAAFETFMKVEESRVRCMARRPGPVVLDRSVDTLLAHAYALDQMYGFGVHDQIRDRLGGLPHLRPDHTVYLDTSAEVLVSRRRAAEREIGRPDYFLHDRVFLRHARDYFCGSAGMPAAAEVTVVSGDGSRGDTAAVVRSLAEFWVAQ